MRALILVVAIAVPGLADAAPGDQFAPQPLVESILEKYGKARDAKCAADLTVILNEMTRYDNPEFLAPALENLHYRLSKGDRKSVQKEARRLEIRKRKEVEKLILCREEEVQIQAAILLGNHKGKASARALVKVFKDRDVRKQKSRLVASVIESMARIDYRKEWKEILKDLKAYRDKEVMRAAVRYFGITKEKRALEALCNCLDIPGHTYTAGSRESHVQSSQVDCWKYILTDVKWALKEITGQTFSSTPEARNWIRKHKRELGL